MKQADEKDLDSVVENMLFLVENNELSETYNCIDYLRNDFSISLGNIFSSNLYQNSCITNDIFYEIVNNQFEALTLVDYPNVELLGNIYSSNLEIIKKRLNYIISNPDCLTPKEVNIFKTPRIEIEEDLKRRTSLYLPKSWLQYIARTGNFKELMRNLEKLQVFYWQNEDLVTKIHNDSRTKICELLFFNFTDILNSFEECFKIFDQFTSKGQIAQLFTIYDKIIETIYAINKDNIKALKKYENTLYTILSNNKEIVLGVYNESKLKNIMRLGMDGHMKNIMEALSKNEPR